MRALRADERAGAVEAERDEREQRRDEAEAAVAFMREADRIFAVLDDAPQSSDEDAEIDAMVAERDAARQAKDYARADALRDALAERGIEVLDGQQNTRWRRR